MWINDLCKRARRFCLTFLLVAISLNTVVLAANLSNQSAAPNPFNPSLGESSTISYDLANNSLLWLKVYDSGATLQRDLVTPGSFTATNRTAGAGKTEVWNGRNNATAILPNGSYPYHIDSAFFEANSSAFSLSGQQVHDIAVDPSDPNIVWSLNKSDNYVYKSTNGGVNFSPVNGTGADAKAYGIVVSNNGQTIYIANEGQGALIRSTNGGSSWGVTANLPSTQPRDVAINSSGSTIYVTASGGSIKDVYKSTNSGASWSICSLSGITLSDEVRGVATDATGTTLLIVDSANDRILRSADGCSSASVVPNISSGSGAGQLSNPYQVELLGDGKFWVSDRNNHRIQQFDANGNVLMVYGGTTAGSGNYQFDFATNKYPGLDVATIAGQPYIFVADYNNIRVKRIGFDNWVSSTDIVISANTVPVGGYTIDDVIPAGQISQASDGSGNLTISWKARDNQADNVILNTFQYSDDGGSSWYTPNNGDASGALSVNWDDNGGGGWSSATSLAAATAHSFSFNSQHADVTAVRSLDNVDQSDIQIRFTVNDGASDSANPVTSESVRVDNLNPNNTIISSSYDPDTDTLILTGTNFTSIAATSTDIKSYVDWSKMVWDINADNAVSANISFVLGDVSSLTVTNASTLTLVVTAAKGAAIETTPGVGAPGGTDSLDVAAGFSIDVFGNAATTDGVSDGPLARTNNPPVGGFSADDVIPAGQISQATDGSGNITINWKARDDQSDNVSLNSFQYSDDGGVSWHTPNNGDASAALSANWDDNGGGGWSTATSLAAATAHSFTFNSQHADVTAVRSLDNVDQSDIQIRFTVNDGSVDSVNPATSQSVQVDNLNPNVTIVSAAYDADTDILVVTGTNFTSIAPASSDIKSIVDGTKFVWDINGDDAVSADITFVLADVTSLTVTNATTLTLVLTAAKGAAIEATAGYGAAGGADTLDVTAGFSIDAFGNVATSDGVSNGPLTSSIINTPPVAGYMADEVIPSGQISQATDGSGLVSINWKARDDQSDNVTLNSFQYSDDGGTSWFTPNNGDLSAALSTNWDDNGGASWTTATSFAAASTHSFSFNSQHADVTAVKSLDNIDQSDIQIRFTVNDGASDSVNPATSENVSVDNLAPTDTIVSGTYDPGTDTLVITGTNFTSIAATSTDIKTYVDWSKLVWDINGDNAVSANISIALGDVSSLTVTNATTLTLVFTAAKGTAIEATPGVGVAAGADSLDVATGFSIDVFGNAAATDGVSDGPLTRTNNLPVGGYSADDVIPAGQISQATDGSGNITINWKARDDQSDNVSLNSFQYSDDGGASWYTPNNGDASGVLSANWDDNGGGGWSTASTFAAATAHSFSFNSQHADVTVVRSLDNVDQSDIQIRFTVNDGASDSASPVTSESVRVDNLAPNVTIVSSAYNAATNTLVISGTNFTSIAPASTDIKGDVDWSKLLLDINGDNAVTADLSFVLTDVSSLIVTNDTTLTLVFTAAKGVAIEASAGFGAEGGGDTLDVTSGFLIDAVGNVATTDGVSDVPLGLTAPVGGYTADDLIPSGQISQATDGSGIITINWKARDAQSDNVSLKSFQYSDDGGSSWYTPNNSDASAALSPNWDDNGGSGWGSAASFAAATAHSFSFNSQHADITAVQSLDNVDQSDIQIRFTVNDGSSDSVNPATSESVAVDNLAPNDSIISGTYDPDTDTLVLTGTNFTSIAPATSDIKGDVDWSKFVWDINADNAVTADISVVLVDVSSLTVTNSTTLTLVFTAAKGTAIEASAGVGAAGGADSLDVAAGFSIDGFGNVATTDGVSDGLLALTNTPPVAGYTADDLIPSGQISQASDGSGVLSINWKVRDSQSDNVSLNSFQYSDDGGTSWYTPNNGDASAALSADWNDNGAGGWSSATSFAAATAHSFSFNTQHADVTAVQSLDNVEQNDIKIRITVNDGSVDSIKPASSESVVVDNLAPTDTIVSSAYNADTDTLVFTGTNFTSIAPASTDIKAYVDWSKLIWDINGDDAVSADINFSLADVSSLTVTNATTLTLVFTAAKGAAIEASAGYGTAAGADTLDVSAGFSIDAFGNVATSDGISDVPLDLNAPVGGYAVDNVIPAAQISQATDGSGVLSINWKARDNQADNVTLNSFQYSDDGGVSWYTPNNGDASAALSANWENNSGSGWSSASTFAAAIAHSFSFDSQHADVTAVQSLDNVEQNDIQIRFIVNDGSVDSVNSTTSESVPVDNLAPTNTIASSAYNADTDTLIITGTNFTSIAPASTDIKAYVDWTKLIWDINGDDAVSADITFVITDVSSLTVTNATTLTLTFTAAKGAGIEATAGYSTAGGIDTLDVLTGFSIDAVGNVANSDGISNALLDLNAPVGGYAVDNVIPVAQISQATDGSGVLSINWKARDNQADNVILNSFQYSDDGGSNWYTPNNGDASAALSTNWDDNGGSGWSSASTFAAATAHSFSFNTQHVDVTAVQSLDNAEQSDIQFRFVLNDGSVESINPVSSESVVVDNLAPTNTITSSAYNADTDTLVINGTNFTSIAPAATDIKSYVDWSKLVWDINGDDAVSADITFVLADVDSLSVTNATTLTLTFTAAKGAAIEASVGYGAVGGADSLDVTAGFSIDALGNAAISDAVSDGLLMTNVSIAGTVYNDDDKTIPLVGESVRLLINGVDSGLTDITDGSGNFTIASTSSPGDLLLLYIDSGGGEQGTVVTVSNGLSLAGVDIYQNHLVVRHDNAGVMSNAFLNSATNGDADILYTVVGNNLTVSGANELYIASGHRYFPGGDVTTPNMESRGIFNGGANVIDINGALNITAGEFTATSTVLSIQGDYVLSGGVFTHNNGSVIFDGENQMLTGSTTFNNFTKTDSINDATDVELIFDNSATQTIIGTLRLDGLDADDRINLVSNNSGQQWRINLAETATKAIDFVDVMDSDASASDASQLPVNPADSVNSGNNLQWFIGAVSSVLAEIDRVSIPVNSVANNFNYDLLLTIGADDTGVDTIIITVPAGYTNLAVNAIFIGTSELVSNCPTPGAGEYCAVIAGQVITVMLGSKITTTGTNVSVQFTADAPGEVGSGSFTAAVDDSATVLTTAQITQTGNADGDAQDENSQMVDVIAFNGLEGSTLIASPVIVTADGISTSTLTATLLDNSNTPVPGKNVTFSSDRGVVDVVTQPVALSDATGVAVGSIRSTTPGLVTITATDTTDDITLTDQVQVYFSQGLVLGLTKTANKHEVVVGDIVTYQIAIKNTTNNDIDLVTLEDNIPPNFKYLKGSARMDGVTSPDPVGNQLLQFAIGTVPALIDTNENGEADPQEQGHLLLSYQLIVGAGATPGDYVNTAYARDVCNACLISNTVNESVEVFQDPLFDLGTIIGKVFNDKNQDGWQDKDETGIAGVMVVLDDGSYVLTDSHGRYHIPAVSPGQRLLKINAQSLPSGSGFTTPVTQVLSVSPGLLVKANFGVLRPIELRKIGRKGESSLNIARKELSESTVDVYGSVAMQNLFVNGSEVPVAKVDVEMFTNAIAQDDLNFSDGILKEIAGFKPTTNRKPEATRNWELQILTPEGVVVRRFKADGILPPSIPWNGLALDNKPLEGGRVYDYQMFVEFWDGNQATSPRRLFTVNERSALNVNMTGDAFQSGSTMLSAAAKGLLKNVANALRENPDGQIFIDGHTDTFGTSASNMALSKARAEAAAIYLVDSEAIARDRLQVRGFGETRPVASDNSPEQRSLNRRIEIHGNISKLALANPFRRFTTEPVLSINGENIELDKYFLFRQTMVLQEAVNLAIMMKDRVGRSSLTQLYAPKLQLPNQGVDESYRIVFPPMDDQRSGIAISEYHFEGTTVPGSVVEFDDEPVQVAADGTFLHKIGLTAGKSTHNLVVTAPSGYTRISTFELTAADHDEAGRPLYLVEPVPFLELDVPADGARVSSKIYTVSGKTDPTYAVFVDDDEIGVEADGSFSHSVKLHNGHNLIAVKAVNAEGFVGSVEHSVEAIESDLFLMAFADGKFGQLKGKGYLEGAGMQVSQEYYNEGRVAYYLKGVIKGKYLITSAFDSGSGEINKLLDGLDEQDNSKLFTHLDPDKLYPVYGDSSTLVNDIESQGKFYLSLESDEVNVIVGNYEVGINDTELASYQRTLYGGRASYQSLASSMSGRADTRVVVFAADVKQAPVHDELRATGGSLYYLSHGDIIEGGEQVVIVVRDKDTGLTLSRTLLRRNIDYRIYYDQGRLITTDSIASVVEDQSLFDSALLSGNPVSLEVDYEARLSSLEKKAYGARLSKTLNKNIAVGVTQINDELDDGEYELSAVDAEMRFGRAVRLLAELAQSSGVDSQTYLSLDGGLTFNNITPTGELNGDAWKAAMELDVGELFGDPGRMFVDAYLKRLSEGFLSSGNFLERGTRKAGINMLYSLSSQSKLMARYTTEESDVDVSNLNAITETSSLSLQWRYDAARWGVTSEYQSRDITDASSNEVGSNKYITGQVQYQATEKVTARLERQQTITGIENDQTTLGADYQITETTKMTGAVVQGTQGKAAKAGIQWLFDGGKLYLDERLTQDTVGQSSLSTVVGGESQLGSNTRVYSEYQIENADAGDRQVELFGADRFWQLQKGLLFRLAAEHSQITGDLTGKERYTLSTSLSYKGQSGLSWSAKNEVRRDRGDENLLQYLSNFLIEQKLNPDYTLLFKYQLSQTRNQDLDTIEADFNEHSIGLAYRPVASDRLNLLARYTGISDKRPLNLGDLNSQESQVNVFSIEWSLDLTHRLEWVDKLAVKVKTEENGSYEPFTSHTRLSIHRLNYQFAKAWDVGAEYRSLAQREAKNRSDGWLTEVMWRASEHMRLGLGFNFTDFSDNEFSDHNYSVKGAFVRLQGMY